MFELPNGPAYGLGFDPDIVGDVAASYRNPNRVRALFVQCCSRPASEFEQYRRKSFERRLEPQIRGMVAQPRELFPQLGDKRARDIRVVGDTRLAYRFIKGKKPGLCQSN